MNSEGLGGALSASGQAASAEMSQPMDMPSPQEAAQALEQNVTGPLPQTPNSRAGRFGNTVGEFLGNPASYVGPGSLLAKIAMATAGGIGSEAAGQMTEGTKAEPLARVAGALAGGAMPSAVERMLVRPPTIPVPSSDALRAAADQGYGAARASTVELRPSALSDLADTVATKLNADGINSKLAPRTFDTLSELQNPPSGATVTAPNLDTLRKVLGNIAADGRGSVEAKAALTARSHLDTYLENVPHSDLLNGTRQTAQEFSDLIKQSNANYAALKRGDLVQGKGDTAELNAAAVGSGTGLGDQVRKQIKSILARPSLRSGFSDPEIAEMNRIVRGTPVANTARVAGNVLGGDLNIKALLAGYAGMAALGPHGVITPVLGYAMKSLYNQLTAKRLAALADTVRANSPLGRSMAASVQQPQRTMPMVNPMLAAVPMNGASATSQQRRAQMKPATDPDLLAKLNARTPVTDPVLIRQLEGLR